MVRLLARLAGARGWARMVVVVVVVEEVVGGAESNSKHEVKPPITQTPLRRSLFPALSSLWSTSPSAPLSPYPESTGMHECSLWAVLLCARLERMVDAHWGRLRTLGFL